MKVTSKPSPAKRSVQDLINSRTQARVGWFESAKYPSGTPAAYVASIQEYGYAGGKTSSIPPRPFIRPTIINQKAVWFQYASRLFKTYLKGGNTIQDIFEVVGERAAGDIRKAITQVSAPPLSPITILLRKWRKQGAKSGRPIRITRRTVGWAAAEFNKGAVDISGVSTKPLNDTGYLLATLTNQTVNG